MISKGITAEYIITQRDRHCKTFPKNRPGNRGNPGNRILNLPLPDFGPLPDFELCHTSAEPPRFAFVPLPPFLISPPGRCVPVRCTIVSCCLWYELMCWHLLWLNGTGPGSAGTARRYPAKDCPPLPPAVRSLESLKTSRSVPPRLRAARERFSAARQRLFVLII